MLDSIGKTFKTLLQIARRYYHGLSLQLKFALVIGSITFAVILLLSLAVLEAEKRVLRQKVDELCKLSAQSLSIVAEDNLLLDNNVPIQEVINNMVELKLEGFESAFVLDRNGVIVAHSDVSMINQERKEYLAYLDSQDLLSVIEHENNTEYLNAIPVTIERDGETKRVNIGLAEVKFSHAMIQAALNRSKRVVFLITSGALILGILLASLFSKRLSANIINLAGAVREIGKGNLDVQIDIPSRDEIGLLAEEVNRMVQSLRENIQMKKYVSPLAVDMIETQSERGTEVPSMEKREIAVLFSDIRGFTSLSESLEPENLVDVINVYLDLQSKHIEENGGIIDKFAGDEVMAIFQGEAAPDDSLTAAVNIQRGVIEINQRRRREKKESLTVGIGINFGEAMLGSMGPSSRMDYTAIGDVVNLASKLCNFARSGHIVVTKNVIQRLNGSFSVVKMDPAKLSGRQKSVPIYRVSY
jgi:adenylate cyclase